MKAQLSLRDYENLSAYLDGQLSGSEKARLEERMRIQPELRSALDEMSRTRALLRMAPRHRAPRNFTLTPAMVQARQNRSRGFFNFFPALSFASAIATLALVFSFFFELGPAPAMTGAPMSDANAPMQGQVMEETFSAAQALPEMAPQEPEQRQGVAQEAPADQPPGADASMKAQNESGSVVTWGFPGANSAPIGGGGGMGGMAQGLGGGDGTGGGGDVFGMGGGSPDGSFVVPLESAQNLELETSRSAVPAPETFSGVPTLEGSGPILGVPEAGQGGQYLEPLATAMPPMDSSAPSQGERAPSEPSLAPSPAEVTVLGMPVLRFLQALLGLLALVTGAAAVWLWRTRR